MKKLIALFAALIMLTNLMPMFTYAESIIYEEKFETLTTEKLAESGWIGQFRIAEDLTSKPASGLGTLEIVTDSDSKYGKVLKICDNDPSQYFYVEKTFQTVPGDKTAVVEFDFKSTNYGTIFMANDHARGYDNNTNNTLAQVTIMTDKLLYRTPQGTEKSQQSVKSKVWHHFKLVVNCGVGLYDVYVDGELIAKELSYRWPKGGGTSSGYLNRIMFGCYQGDNSMTTETYIDNLTVTIGDSGGLSSPVVSPPPAATQAPAPVNTPKPDVKAPESNSSAVKSFKDINGHWAKATIEELTARGIINGVSDVAFEPDSQITRAEFTALAARAIGLKELPYNNAYEDVFESDWFAKIVQASKNISLIDSNMTIDGFNGFASINREEMTSIVINAYKTAKSGEISKADLGAFEDKSLVSQWAYDYVAEALGLGIIKGKSDAVFDPKNAATRAEAATMIKRLIVKTGASIVANQPKPETGTSQPQPTYNIDNTADREKVLSKIKLIYSSDTTNILSCISPWHPTSSTELNEGLIKAPAIEAAEAGMDVYSMQPGVCWVPWWKSEVYPIEEHLKWFKENVRENASNTFLNYTLEGNDIIQQSIDACRSYGKDFMLSFRLNDQHQKEYAYDAAKARVESVPKIFWDHPEYLVGTDPNQASYGSTVQDWQYDEVRAFKTALIKELIQNYDIDGLELDFMRSVVLFNTTTTTHDQRDAIMLDFIKTIRAELDKKGGRYRYLAVRVPGHIYSHDAMGIDVKKFSDAGVDIFTLSTYYCMEQETSMAEIKQIVGNKSLVFPELTYTTSFEKNGADRVERRATAEQLNTAAYLAYKNGGDGVALFNYQYYRQRVNQADSPYCEPLFELLEGFKDVNYLAKQNQHYYYATNHRDPKKPTWPLPQTLEPSKTVSWELDMASPEGGWTKDGKFRIQGSTSLGSGEYTAKINGVLLSSSNDLAEPYESPFPHMQGKPEELRSWVVPRSILKEGHNKVEVTQISGDKVVLEYVDLAIR